MKKIKPVLKIIGWLAVLAILYLGGVILYGTLTDYKPKPESSELLEIKGKAKAETIDSVLNLFTWNLGYGGLGKEMDFFYDGGKAVRAPRDIWDKDFKGQEDLIAKNDSIDFYLIQEIDRNSARSYEVDQFREINHALEGFTAAFAINYNVKFVPAPYFRPMGKVYGGVAMYSKYTPLSATRFQYPGHFPWPTRIFFLDRCFISERFALQNGKELIVIDTHNSAYDESGTVKSQEMEFLKKYMMAEYEKGNYVIAGGDWNQSPPGYDSKTFAAGGPSGFIPPDLDFDYLPEGWLWCYDPTTPTNRNVDKPLNAQTFKTIIDFFVISPNIQILKVKAIDTGFDFSDHQPVVMQVELE